MNPILTQSSSLDPNSSLGAEAAESPGGHFRRQEVASKIRDHGHRPSGEQDPTVHPGSVRRRTDDTVRTQSVPGTWSSDASVGRTSKRCGRAFAFTWAKSCSRSSAYRSMSTPSAIFVELFCRGSGRDSGSSADDNGDNMQTQVIHTRARVRNESRTGAEGNLVVYKGRCDRPVGFEQRSAVGERRTGTPESTAISPMRCSCCRRRPAPVRTKRRNKKYRPTGTRGGHGTNEVPASGVRPRLLRKPFNSFLTNINNNCSLVSS